MKEEKIVENKAKITLKNIYAFIQGNIRYIIYSGGFYVYRFTGKCGMNSLFKKQKRYTKVISFLGIIFFQHLKIKFRRIFL